MRRRKNVYRKTGEVWFAYCDRRTFRHPSCDVNRHFYQNVPGVLPYGMISGLAVGLLADTYYTIKTKIKVI